MREIKLTKDLVALIDEEDYERVSAYKWTAWESSPGRFYAARKDSFFGTVYLHRFIMGNLLTKKQIDHINGNKLDNRKENLRFVTASQNQANSNPSYRGKSKYKGVTWHTQNCNWFARIRVNYKEIYLGVFESEGDAAVAYDIAAARYFGSFAKLNFPEVGGAL